MTNTPDTAALLALDAARTPGEWRWSDDSGVGCSMFDGLEIKTNQPRIIDGRTDDEVMNCETDTEDNAPYAAFWNTADAEIIVAAVNALGPLCRRVAELEALSEQKGFALDELNTQLAAANERIAEAERLLWELVHCLDESDGPSQFGYMTCELIDEEARKFLEAK